MPQKPLLCNTLKKTTWSRNGNVMTYGFLAVPRQPPQTQPKSHQYMRTLLEETHHKTIIMGMEMVAVRHHLFPKLHLYCCYSAARGELNVQQTGKKNVYLAHGKDKWQI